MMIRNKTDKTILIERLGLALFVLGITTALVFQTAFTWGTIEATRFDPADPGLHVASENLDTLRCPLVITGGETATITASFTNPTDRSRNRIVRANISDGFITMRREVSTNLLLEPGETETLAWEITPEDAVWGRFVFVRVFAVRSSAEMPAQTGTCSILALNWLGIPGRFLANGLIALSVLGPILGIGLWGVANRPLLLKQEQQLRLLGMLTAVILLGLFLSLSGYWIPNVVLLVITLFLIVNITLSYLVDDHGRA